MKKQLFFLTLLTLSIFIISCGDSSNASTEEVTANGETTDTLPQHKFFGIYNGILPCSNCSGIQTILHLMEDGTYTKRSIYLGRDTDEIIVEDGKFTWNPEGSMVTLTSSTATVQYLVGEDRLTQLNENGQPYQGSDAGQYILNRAEVLVPTPVTQE